MEKEDYEQLINTPVKALIKDYLAWSGSDKGMPSMDMGNVRGAFISACREECYTVDEWKQLSEGEKDEFFANLNSEFDDVAIEADRRWEAAKVMLGL